MTYAFLSLWIVPFGIVLVVHTIPRQLRGLWAAREPSERAYWVLNLVGCLVAAYGAISVGLEMADEVRGGPWQLATWWPSLARHWWRFGDRTIIALLDLLITLATGLAVICIARYFGYVDENDVWRNADLLAGLDAVAVNPTRAPNTAVPKLVRTRRVVPSANETSRRPSDQH